MSGDVGEFERRKICDQVDRILRDLSVSEPPVRLEDVRALLKLDLKFYQSSDPGIVTELAHRFTLFAKKTIPDVGKHLASALAKSRLCAFWVPDDSRILIDETVPQPKHRWIEAHEIIHSVTPWHREFLLGDNAFTLEPSCHATLEAEANFGGSRLLFLQDLFSREARDLDLSFKSIQALGKRYSNSMVSTFWRMVEDRDPSLPIFGMISCHPRHPAIGKHDGPDPWRYFIRSAAFKTQFSNVTPSQAYLLVSAHVDNRTRGPVLSADDVIVDVSGTQWEFHMEAFSNTHCVMTYGVAAKPRKTIVVRS